MKISGLSVFLFFISMKVFANPGLEMGKFSIGSLSTIVVHEFSHAAVMELTGGDVYEIDIFKNGIFSGEVRGNKGSKYISSAGLISTSLITEGIIQNRGWHNNSFAQGFVFFSLLSNIWQVKTYYTKSIGKNGYAGNDIDLYESYGGNPHILSAGLVLYSVFSVYRISNNTDMISFAKMNLFGVKMEF